MNIKITYPDTDHAVNVVSEAKRLARDSGLKIKDIGTVELHYSQHGISINVYDTQGKWITNCLY